ncbi:MAG TPA: ATP-binding cassette domain-containing protein [Stellaceae bacterium]|nr:ATP-binding cassette domain-containing protein [Stellaceae bacterium]
MSSAALAPTLRGLGDRAPWVLAALCLAAYAATASPYGLRVLALAGAQVVLVLGYQFIFGHAGALSLAQGAFFGIGAYVTAILGGRYGLGFLASFPVSILAPSLLAAAIAAPVLRLATHYFALATLGLAQVALLAAVNGGAFTGGALGITGVPGIVFFGWAVPRGLGLVAAVWLVVAAASWLSVHLTRGLTGRAYAVLRGNPLAASAIGLSEQRLRLAAFLLSAGYAGAAGALHAHILGVVSSESMAFSVMVACLAMTVIGGSTRLAGAFIGALLLTYLPEWLRSLEGYSLLAFGAALLAAIVAAPTGIAGALAKAVAALGRTERPILPTPAELPVPQGPSGLSLLVVRGLAKRFGGIEALKGLDLTIDRGEILGVIGPNGSGKTTLANLVTGFAPTGGGTVILEGRNITALGASEIARAGVGRSFQNPALPPELTVLEIVTLARASLEDDLGFRAALAGRDRSDRRERHEAEAMYFLRSLGADGYAHALCASLPYRAAWRVEIARILALEPKLVILDEPASGLTEAEQGELARTLRRLARLGLGLLVIEHNMPFLLPVADRILVLDEGRAIASGKPEEVRQNPAVISAYLGRKVGLA